MKTIIDQDFTGVHHVEIRLSRRNLLALLAKLDRRPPSSACTILGPSVYVPTTLTAEEDDVHYNDAERVAAVGDNRPGRMHPDTESAINQVIERTGMSDRDVRSVKDDEEGNAEGYQGSTRGAVRDGEDAAEAGGLSEARSPEVTDPEGQDALSV